ncbi:MAG: hypothetical protein RBS36_12375 [Thiomicrospira sp.]|jgi:hypothetical protein|nr:hypothetical protein [Thiomicrospira sp.]
MKNLFLTVLMLVPTVLGFAQNDKNGSGFLVTDYQWDIARNDSMATMQMDVPFDNQSGSFDTLLLVVEKSNQQKRPARMCLQIPADAERNIGVMINFGKTVKKDYGYSSELGGEPLMAPYTHCDELMCFVDFQDGYAGNEASGNKTDIFASFNEFDTIIIFFMYLDGRQANLMIPLESFKKTYPQL